MGQFEKLVPTEILLYRIIDEQNLLIRKNCKLSIELIIKLIYDQLSSDATNDSIGMCDRFFESCYLELIYDFAKFVQTLPEPGLQSSMLEHALARAAAMLQYLIPQLCIIAEKEAKFGGMQKLLYVVFSSALLYEIGCIEQERVIHLCNSHGHFIRRWDPLMGCMDSASHFKIRYRTGWKDSLKLPLTYFFARKLMPDIGLLWMSDSPAALALWFSLLADPVEEWAAYSITFRWEALNDVMNDCLKNLEDNSGILTESTLLGEIFWDWLKDSLHKGSLSSNSNGADVHFLSEGLVIDTDVIFETFKKYFTSSIDKIILFQQFNALGLSKLSGGDTKFDQYFSSYPEAGGIKNIFDTASKKNIVNGILIDQAHNLLLLNNPLSAHLKAVRPVSWLASFMQHFQQDSIKNTELTR